MRRLPILLVTAILLSACADAASPSASTPPECDPNSPVSSDQTVAPDDHCPPASPTTPPAVTDLEITCAVFTRAAVTEPTGEAGTVILVTDGDTGRASGDGLAFEALYADDEYEGRALYVSVTEDGREVMRETYAMPRDRAPVNEFGGGHGFTGLVYAYSVDGAEMQYFCDARVVRDQ